MAGTGFDRKCPSTCALPGGYQMAHPVERVGHRHPLGFESEFIQFSRHQFVDLPNTFEVEGAAVDVDDLSKKVRV
ncbi:hypothetical protein GCM10023189_24140 [Nibrella saemangeumensis]|uniref:Uncharacterized protein n=1 Tax=Nibrella saemangeumensis TaxID=1084526 RepID=A0ABP8MW74_9BACT